MPVVSDLPEIENPVPLIVAVGAAVRFEPLIVTALVEVVPSTHVNSIVVGFIVHEGSGVVDVDVPAGSMMSLFKRTSRS